MKTSISINAVRILLPPVAILLLVSCSHIRRPSAKVTTAHTPLEISRKAKVRVVLIPNKPPIACSLLKPQVSLEILAPSLKPAFGRPYAMETQCMKDNSLVATYPKYMPPGKYTLRIQSRKYGIDSLKPMLYLDVEEFRWTSGPVVASAPAPEPEKTEKKEPPAKPMPLSVIDKYPTGARSSIVLMRPVSGVKAEQNLKIAAKNRVGHWRDLGICKVLSATEDSTQCELDGNWEESFVEYRATRVAEGT